jgi:hypothetical protein
MPRIYTWEDIEERFNKTVILGNGASIAIDRRFRYDSLLTTARELSLISEGAERLFEQFDTEDFELVLSLLWQAYKVNEALGIEPGKINQVYEEVRSALIEAVRRNHARHEEVSLYLVNIYKYLKRFDKVISLNYDLLVYWAMLAGNDELGSWFKDCFINGEFESSWKEYLVKPHGAEGATLVFYPHGNLALATTIVGGDKKVIRQSIEELLLDRIVTEWESGESVPLFVSEGESKQKEVAIKRNGYLNDVFHNVLRDLGDRVVIYGWSLSENDEHILRQIARSQIEEIAISIYRGSRTDDDLQDRAGEVLERLYGFFPEANIYIFYSESEGCWIY